jgi:L-amino acid N-acyltransferase YncA
MHLSVRHARAEDLNSIVDIYNSTVSAGKVTADTEPVTVESRRAWFERHHEKRPVFVIEDGKSVLGWVSFEDFYGRPAYQITAEISIYIREGRRRTGLGDKLLRHAINEALHTELERLLAFIFADNQPSLMLFQKYGFVKWGKLPAVAEIDGQYHDLCILGLIL